MGGAMAEADDAYAILGIAPEATAEQVRAAYRRLARKYHPDVTSEAEAGGRMAAINRAYAVLADPARRAQYDRARRPPPSISASVPAPTPPPPPVWSADLDGHADDWRQA